MTTIEVSAASAAGCDWDNQRLRAYYEGLGFTHAGDVTGCRAARDPDTARPAGTSGQEVRRRPMSRDPLRRFTF